MRVAHGTRAQQRELGGRRDQRVELLLLLGEQRIKEPFAHPQRRHDDLGRAHPVDDFEQHRGAVRQKRAAVAGHLLDALHLLHIALRDRAQEVDAFLQADLVMMHDGKRIAGHVDVEPREVSPGAAPEQAGAPEMLAREAACGR
jgi:hypothetical protein